MKQQRIKVLEWVRNSCPILPVLILLYSIPIQHQWWRLSCGFTETIELPLGEDKGGCWPKMMRPAREKFWVQWRSFPARGYLIQGVETKIAGSIDRYAAETLLQMLLCRFLKNVCQIWIQFKKMEIFIIRMTHVNPTFFETLGILKCKKCAQNFFEM